MIFAKATASNCTIIKRSLINVVLCNISRPFFQMEEKDYLVDYLGCPIIDWVNHETFAKVSIAVSNQFAR